MMRVPAVHAASVASRRPSLNAGAALLQRQCNGCAQEAFDEQRKHDGAIQRKSAGPAEPGGASASVSRVLRSSGEALDTATRAYFEPRFGHDFSQVRIHADSLAAQSARAVGAHA